MAVVVAQARRRAQQKRGDKVDHVFEVEKQMPAADRCLLVDLLRRKQGRYFIFRVAIRTGRAPETGLVPTGVELQSCGHARDSLLTQVHWFPRFPGFALTH